MIDKKILSLPVWSKQKRRFLGLVDVTDFVAFIVKHFSKDILAHDNVDQFLSVQDRFSSLHVSTVMSESDHDPWYPVESDAPLRKLFETFCRGNMHRLPVLDDGGEVVTLASQSDAIAFLAANIKSPHMQKLAHTVLADAHIGTWGNVASVKTTDPALDAFNLIHRRHVTGVAVVNETGKLISNISASDLRLIEHHGASLSVLFKSCADFVDIAHSGKADGVSLGHGKILHLSARATFSEAVMTMDRTHVHRLFVVDEHGAPAAVISQFDLIKAVRDWLQK